ncbi:site-specific DNA-methyltransferase, partial [Pseudomonas sp.]|uniref:DNA-methyltransferase n=1 Tax=Pseudomonas sp. TaxID=306 RepID=UPI002589D601
KRWDYDGPSVEMWAECLRVLKPGGHLLAFAGTRTQHRMAVRIEDAGFEIRDMIAWVYGSGFPKSRNLDGDWQGWGTALKPALEPITVARKPLIGTVAANVLQHGTGALNIDGCRVGTEGGTAKGSKPDGAGNGIYGAGLHGACEIKRLDAGRWPANLIRSGSEPADLLGEAARFFYCAKASKRDRDEGLEGFEAKAAKSYEGGRIVSADHPETAMGGASVRANNHPTVKPTDLMRYLCRLVTPPGGLVLDPFMGSGSTGKAALQEGFRFVGIEREAQYLEIARARIEAERTKPQPDLFSAAMSGSEIEPGEAA